MKTDLTSLMISSVPAPTRPAVRPETPTSEKRPPASRFESMLEEQATGDVRFSKHAEKRLESRGVSVAELGALRAAIEKLREKGARSSLVLTDEAALIVNVPENRVVTAMSRHQLKENVFTNIDSTIII